MVFRKISKTIGLLRKLHNFLPRAAFITIYKAFIRPHLDYGDILYDQAYNMSFHQKLESSQYNARLAITGTIRGTSIEKLYQERGLESLQLCRWYRKLGMFYKIFKSKSPQYRFKLIPEKTSSYVTKNAENIPLFNIKHNFFFFFSIRVFFHGHWQLTGQQGKGGDHLIPLYNFHPLTNIQTFICNFAREMSITYF